MKLFQYIFLFLVFSGFAQETVETIFVKSTELHADSFVGVDNFETLYYLKANVLYSKSDDNILSYNNIQLGNISSVNSFNPLKINIFYQDFNTIVILDNRLAEIFKIDFSVLQPYKNVSLISTGYDNSIWIFNQDTQQLELYDFKIHKTRAQTLPILSNVLDLKSNYNYAWLLTQDYFYTYNYFGSLVSKIKNNAYTSFSESNGNYIFKKGNELHYLKKDSEQMKQIVLPELLIKQFLVTNETLYIYDEEFLHEYQLKTN